MGNRKAARKGAASGIYLQKQVSGIPQSEDAIDTASLKSALLDCERTFDTKDTTASPAYEPKGWTADFVLLSKSSPAPAPAYSEKPSSLVDLSVRLKDVKTAPEELSKEKEVPLAPEPFTSAEPTGVDSSDLSDCDPTPEFEWAAAKVAEMEFEEYFEEYRLRTMLLASIAEMDAAAEARAAAEAADKIVEFDGVKYVKAW